MITEIYQRFTSRSPKIFKGIIKISLSAITLGGAIIGIPITFPTIILQTWLITLATHLIVGGTIAATIAKLTVENVGDLKPKSDVEAQ